MKYPLLKNFYFVAFLMFLLALASCEEKDFQGSRSNDEADLDRQKIEVEKFSGQRDCDGNTEWGILAMTSSSCNGPIGYIAYDKKVDVQELIKKIAGYVRKKEAFDVKWNKGPMCPMIVLPKSVACVDDKAKLVY